MAESDLATYLVDCIDDKSRWGKILNIGGPDEPLTMLKQGEVGEFSCHFVFAVFFCILIFDCSKD